MDIGIIDNFNYLVVLRNFLCNNLCHMKNTIKDEAREKISV